MGAKGICAGVGWVRVGDQRWGCFAGDLLGEDRGEWRVCASEGGGAVVGERGDGLGVVWAWLP